MQRWESWAFWRHNNGEVGTGFGGFLDHSVKLEMSLH